MVSGFCPGISFAAGTVPMRNRLFILIGFLAILTGIRLFLAATIELSPDESYYYLWAQHPDISYYGQGPGVAVAILAGTSLFDSTELGVRFLAPFFGLGTSVFVYLIGRKLVREKAAFWAVLALNLLPIFHLGSIVMTPDSPSLFFWAAALYTSWLAIERGSSFSVFWPLTGILTGLGFQCNYSNAFQIFSILFFLAVVPKYRYHMRRPGFYVCVAVFLIFLAPLVIWNQQHEWITLEHLPERGDLAMALAVRPSQLFEFLESQFLLYSPFLVVSGDRSRTARSAFCSHSRGRSCCSFSCSVFVRENSRPGPCRLLSASEFSPRISGCKSPKRIGLRAVSVSPRWR
jgi:4-amino-4-deoxy-L-arabinose transferase-like glycosyltransferase